MAESPPEFDADVIIIGLGPVGNFTAHLLASFGVKRILAFESGPEKPYFSPRAVTWDATTIRAAIVAGGLDLEQYMRWHAESLKRIDHHQDNFALFKAGSPPNFRRMVYTNTKDLESVRKKHMARSVYAFGDFHQPVWETELRKRLALRKEVKVEYNTKVTHVAIKNGFCEVTVAPAEENGTGQHGTKTYTARYCLASDGGSSNVRKQFGIEYVGETFATWKCLVIDTTVDDEKYLNESWIGQHQTGFFADPERSFVLVRTPAFFDSWWKQAEEAAGSAKTQEETYKMKEDALAKMVEPFCKPGASPPIPPGTGIRFEFSVTDDAGKDLAESDAYINEKLKDINVDPARLTFVRKCLYTHHARQATRWREGPVFLIGDAAHCMPPYAGQGLNAGIGDAVNISWKLALVLQGKAEESLLNTYEPERRVHATEVTKLSTGLGQMLEVRSKVKAFFRDTFFSCLQCIIPFAEMVGATQVPAIRVPQGAVAPLQTQKLAGIYFPCPTLEHDGELKTLDRIMAYNGFTLLVGGRDFISCRLDVSEKILGFLRDLGVVVVVIQTRTGKSFDAKALTLQGLTNRFCRDPEGYLGAWFENERLEGKAIIIRPDKYVFGVFDSVDEGAELLQEALQGRPTAQEME